VVAGKGGGLCQLNRDIESVPSTPPPIS
jgi:hypothetical protein